MAWLEPPALHGRPESRLQVWQYQCESMLAEHVDMFSYPKLLGLATRLYASVLEEVTTPSCSVTHGP